MRKKWWHCNQVLMVLKSQEGHGCYIRDYWITHVFSLKDRFCLLLWCRVPVCFWECVAPMAVLLLMQVAPRNREWSSLTGGRRMGKKRGGATSQPPYSLCLGSFCNEMACVMEALSKQWAYSTCRGVSVTTGLNTIPLLQCASFLSILLCFTPSTVAL